MRDDEAGDQPSPEASEYPDYTAGSGDHKRPNPNRTSSREKVLSVLDVKARVCSQQWIVVSVAWNLKEVVCYIS